MDKEYKALAKANLRKIEKELRLYPVHKIQIQILENEHHKEAEEIAYKSSPRHEIKSTELSNPTYKRALELMRTATSAELSRRRQIVAAIEYALEIIKQSPDGDINYKIIEDIYFKGKSWQAVRVPLSKSAIYKHRNDCLRIIGFYLGEVV